MTTKKKTVSEISVAEIMTRHVEVLSPIDTIQDAVKMMLDSQVTTVPVVDGNNHCVGVLARADLTEMFMEEDSELSQALDTERLSMEWLYRSLETSDTRQVRELMTHEVTTIQAEQSAVEACRMMVDRKIHHLPVTDKENSVVGIVSTFDIVKAVAELAS